MSVCCSKLSYPFALADGWDPVNRFKHTSLMAVVTPTDHPKSVCNPRCVLTVFGGVYMLSSLPFSDDTATFVIWLSQFSSSADPEGGTGGPDPPPLRFVRGGVLCRGLMSRRGGPKVVLTYYQLFFWLASLASIIIYKYITYIHILYFQVQY